MLKILAVGLSKSWDNLALKTANHGKALNLDLREPFRQDQC